MTSFLVLFRLVGYGLLLLTLFDVVSAIIPPQFSNPAWQFQTAGGFVERSAVPLIGFILVFYDNQESRKKREMLVLKILSWIAFLSAIFYLALIVIFFITPPTLNERSQAQVNAQLDPKIAQIKQLQSQVETAQPAQLEILMKNNRVTGSNPQAFKAKLLQDASVAQKTFVEQAEAAKSSQKLILIKNAVKWGLGSLVSGVLFIRIWAGTAWARQ